MTKDNYGVPLQASALSFCMKTDLFQMPVYYQSA